VDIFWLLKDLLYKDIPLTLHVRIDNVMDKENVFNRTNVKYLPCAFERVYVLVVSNLLKDLLYKDILRSFMFMTHKTILTQYDIW
jgi:hypothetical protein